MCTHACKANVGRGAPEDTEVEDFSEDSWSSVYDRAYTYRMIPLVDTCPYNVPHTLTPLWDMMLFQSRVYSKVASGDIDWIWVRARRPPIDADYTSRDTEVQNSDDDAE